MTMTGLNRTAHDVQHRAADWIRHAARDPSPQAEAAARWAVARLEEANVPDVVHAVVLTLTGKKKAAKQARKAAEAAVRRAERKLNRVHPGHGRAWLAIGLLATAAAGAAFAWQRSNSGQEPEADQSGELPADAI